jgi:hypothetical protein
LKDRLKGGHCCIYHRIKITIYETYIESMRRE